MTVISNQTPPKTARIRCFAREPCSTNLSRRCRSRACDLWSNASGLCCWKSRCSLAFMGSSENEGIHQVVESIAATTTKTGLKVESALDTRHYQKGLKVSKAEMKSLNIKGHDSHPEWNYTVRPRQSTKT